VSAVRQFRIVYVFLAAQFIVPAISYIASPAMTIATLNKVNRALGGGAYSIAEGNSSIWHMLAVGNVMTLGFMCGIMAWDLKRYYGMLPGLAFLKRFSAIYSLALGFTEHVPMFFAVFALDGIACASSCPRSRTSRSGRVASRRSSSPGTCSTCSHTST